MRVALLQISCVCHHMAPVARGRPAGPVTDPPNNGLLLLPCLLLCTTLLLASTEHSNAFANHHLFPCSWWQLPITYFKWPLKGTQYRNGEKNSFIMISWVYLLLSSKSFNQAIQVGALFDWLGTVPYNAMNTCMQRIQVWKQAELWTCQTFPLTTWSPLSAQKNSTFLPSWPPAPLNWT